MVLICPKCEARLQLEEAKAPSRPFTVRCPKCQGAINVQPSSSSAATAEEGQLEQGTSVIAARAAFERPASAPPFKVEVEGSNTASANPASGGGRPLRRARNSKRPARACSRSDPVCLWDGAHIEALGAPVNRVRRQISASGR